ncbi:MAG TPA: DUF433 domain-containing protein [Thermoanaerobaculia bacterium]|nr:DUF433 domain-containing protein [Thermoanaerobaculia bacterium]
MSQERLFHLSVVDDPVPLVTDDLGVVRVRGTRVPLDTVVHVFLTGASAEEIVDRFPTLDLADVYSTIGYYLRHREEIDRYLEERDRYAEKIRAQVEARQGPSITRERLMARRAQLAVREG